MLTEKTARRKLIENVCAESGDVAPGTRLLSAVTAEDPSFPGIPEGEEIVCCGTADGEEMLFRTGDGRFYFSLCGGWGERDGVLYGLRPGFFCDLGRPTDRETLPRLCALRLKRAERRITCMAAAVRYGAEKRKIEKILSVEGMPLA